MTAFFHHHAPRLTHKAGKTDTIFPPSTLPHAQDLVEWTWNYTSIHVQYTPKYNLYNFFYVNSLGFPLKQFFEHRIYMQLKEHVNGLIACIPKTALHAEAKSDKNYEVKICKLGCFHTNKGSLCYTTVYNRIFWLFQKSTWEYRNTACSLWTDRVACIPCDLVVEIAFVVDKNSDVTTASVRQFNSKHSSFITDNILQH